MPNQVHTSRRIVASISIPKSAAESHFGKTLANVGDESGALKLH
jgi:hypothetical protein